MCGICGIINFYGQPVNEVLIRNMMRIMKHRGPDDEGIFINGKVGLGFVRLSIIDLSPAGHQPMHSFDNRYVVVFNGEIYNYVEIRNELKNKGYSINTNTDTEVLLNSYIEWGEDCTNHFNGMFSFIIYDKLNHSVFGVRDRFGIKPFYYIKTNEYFAFCSEIPPLFSLLNKKPTPNYQSIFDFLVFNRTDQTEKTFFTEVLKLQHGHKLLIDDGRVSISKWYDLKESVSKTIGFDSPKEYKELFTSAIALHLRSDVPVGVCLSGGLDSSSIVSVIIENHTKEALNTFSAVYNKGQKGDETDFINEYKGLVKNMYFITPDADTLSKDLSTFVKLHAEPIPGTSPYAQYKVMKLAKGKVVVTLDGQGADEQFGGYHYFFGFRYKDLLKELRILKLFSEIYSYLKLHKSFLAIKYFLYLMLPERLRTRLRLIDNGSSLMPDFENSYKFRYGISRNIYGSKSFKDALLDHFEFKMEHLLKWEDLNSMHFSIEARVPFLDYRLVEKVLATNSELLITGGIVKPLLREAMKGLLPEKIRLRRDKIGFGTPEDEWFRTPTWQAIIEEILSSQSFKNRKLVNPKIALSRYRKHLEGKIDCAAEIWKWIHLELWFREFID